MCFGLEGMDLERLVLLVIVLGLVEMDLGMLVLLGTDLETLAVLDIDLEMLGLPCLDMTVLLGIDLDIIGLLGSVLEMEGLVGIGFEILGLLVICLDTMGNWTGLPGKVGLDIGTLVLDNVRDDGILGMVMPFKRASALISDSIEDFSCLFNCSFFFSANFSCRVFPPGNQGNKITKIKMCRN